MLFTVSELKEFWGIQPNGVLHIGAHLGEESSGYEEFGWGPVIWVEAQPKLAQLLRLKLDSSSNRVIQAAVWDTDDVKLNLHVASNSMSSSLLEFGSHSDSYPEITYVDEIQVETKRLDSILSLEEMPNFVNLDIQGAELPALKGLGSLINNVDYIFVEVNRREVYKNCTIVRDLDSFLSENTFKRVTTRWYYKQGWGDALYIRKNKIKSQNFSQFIGSMSRTSNFYLKQICRLLKIGVFLRLIKKATSKKGE
jgi:FkbM family methyltransferase